MSAFSAATLEEALSALGELLDERGQTYELVLVGGGSLLLMGLLARPTNDLDVVARIEREAYVRAEPMPNRLSEAVRDVAKLLSLGEQWLNPGPTDLLRFGLPEGFRERLETRRYGALVVHLAGRLDQIAFKLYATVDQGPRSKHFGDLRVLVPTRDELLFGARWALTHDTSAAFRDQLEQALEALGANDVDLA